MKITIKDIAKLAGVSHPTVSKALNNEPGVSEETRQKIVALAKKLHYVPNPAAKRMVDRKTNCIGLIWPPTESLFLYNLIMKIQKKAAEAGMTVLVSLADPVTAMRIFNQHFVDHIVFWTGPAWKPSVEFIRELERYPGSLVIVGGGRQEGAHSIGIDRETGVKQALHHLTGLGHNRVAYIGFRSDKVHAYLLGVQENGLYFRPDYTIRVDSRVPFDEEAVTKLLQLEQEQRPTAFIIDSQILFFKVLKLLRDLKLRIPEDLSIIVYDDTPELELFEIPITVIGPSLEVLSDKIITTIKESDASRNDFPLVEETVAAELSVRQSTRAPSL